MSDGHCRHCGTGCTGGTDLGDGPNLHTDMAFAFWRDGRCPACAEGERIAAYVRQWSALRWLSDTIAHGEAAKTTRGDA